MKPASCFSGLLHASKESRQTGTSHLPVRFGLGQHGFDERSYSGALSVFLVGSLVEHQVNHYFAAVVLTHPHYPPDSCRQFVEAAYLVYKDIILKLCLAA